MVAIVQIANMASPERLPVPIDEGSVGRMIGNLPTVRMKRQHAVTLRQISFWVGQHPVVLGPTTNRKLAHLHSPRLRRHAVGTAQHCQAERHRELVLASKQSY